MNAARLIFAALLLVCASLARAETIRDNDDAMHDCAYSNTPASEACLAVLARRVPIYDERIADITNACKLPPANCEQMRETLQYRRDLTALNGHYRDYANVIAKRGFTAEAAIVRAKGKETEGTGPK